MIWLLLLADPEPSRWSNAGAMKPVPEVEVTAKLPERALPRENESTPGQALRDPSDDRLSVHLSFFGSHLATSGEGTEIDLLRGRASFTYERIAGSEFGLHLDAEYRGRLAGTRPDDQRVNALYATWGLTDVERPNGRSFGFALGRLAVPEAGYAQADGLLFRLRIGESVRLGAFGGVTGSPYGYNWRLGRPESIAIDDLSFGAFFRVKGDRWFLSLAGVGAIATVGDGGVDRVFAFADAGWAPRDDLNLFFTGSFDVLPSGQPVQSAELAADFRPLEALHLRLGIERFSTLSYDASALYNFKIDPTDATLTITNAAGNTVEGTAVDENGDPIPAFDGRFEVATYNRVRLRSAYRVGLGRGALDPYADLALLLRDTANARIDLPALRFEPALGLRFHHPDVLDADLRAVLVVDAIANADLVLDLTLAKELFGLRLSIDGRMIVGTVPAIEGGGELEYTLPFDGLPGRLSLFVAGRYIREDIARVLPNDQDTLADDVVLPILPVQESVYLFGGASWRL